ncbi:hypothetical protein Val02_04300 [Virgisporangium aliadipatigenens]|uniref:Aminoglycoside phosphotransferase n=1 Tax=Virgisporangium aliadipatigenens TaxID=741659 RepID=A0A8J3YE98_9ACTN|nr:phosphotransferase [Virgisporangium aliadipatigenens]GIJ43544.1 hypothetical protein Val02_04300 [Virgisporangium aliadipatigenens]
MTPELLAAAGKALGRPLSEVARLAGGERAHVVRATVDGGPETVVVKAHAPGHVDNWRRESAALTVLGGRGLPVPELLAVVADPPLVVLRDLGTGPNLADALLGDDAARATTMLHAWADTLARLHTATTGDAARLAAASGTDPSTVDVMPALLDEAAGTLADLLPTLGIAPEPRALDELRAAPDALSPGAHALTPADACPDNNVLTPDGLVLLDFEQADHQHVAWDAAYLIVPWPTCWCSWGLPAEVARTALERWRAAAPSIVDSDLDVTVSAWAFLSTAWFLRGAFEEADTPPGGGLRGPTRRAVIRHRMRLAAERPDVLPRLATLAERVLAATESRWGDAPLADAPAYRS